MKQNNSASTQKMVLSSIFIALASVLSIFQIISFPFGGGITILSMLPIVIISYRYGVKWGFFSALTFAVLQMLLGFKTVSAFFLPGDNYQIWWKAILICLLDYIVAFTMLGIGGIFRKKGNASVSLCLGSVVALFARYIVHIISGAIFFGSWSGWFFTDIVGGSLGKSVLESLSGVNLAIFYSACYNGLYMIPEIIITAIGAYVVGKIPAITGERQV